MIGRRYVRARPRRVSSGRPARVGDLRGLLGGARILRAILGPLMVRELRDATEETVQAAMLREQGVEATYFEVCEVAAPDEARRRAWARACRRTPAAWQGAARAARRRRAAPGAWSTRSWRALTRNTIVEPEALITELAKVRRRGYATDSEEFVIGLRCLAMPCLPRRGRRDRGLGGDPDATLQLTDRQPRPQPPGRDGGTRREGGSTGAAETADETAAR